MSRPRKVMVCAAEPSGDALGAALIEHLKSKAPEMTISGCGGPAMAAQGLDSLIDIEDLSVIGPVDALRALPAALKGAALLADVAAAEETDAAVLIDSWAFSKMVAKRMRKRAPGMKLFKYVAPQVWASRPKRAETLADLFDGVVTLFDFEVPWFERAGAPTVGAGHPGFQKLTAERGGGDGFRARHDVGDAPLLILAPGSRRSEIKWMAEPFMRTVDMVAPGVPGLRIAIPVAPGRETAVKDAFAEWRHGPIFVGAEEKAAAFDAADAGLIASGTVSTELAICRTPMVVGYRAGWLTAAWAKSVVTTPYASLVNIAVDREIVPDFIQERCAPDLMAPALAAVLTDPAAREAQLSAFPASLERLGAGGAPAGERAADAILAWITDR